MGKIRLSNDILFELDEPAYNILSPYNWSCMYNKGKETIYAGRVVRNGMRNYKLWLHRLLADAPYGWQVRLKNKNNPTDMRKDNLILLDVNKQEQPIREFDGKALFHGARWYPFLGLWESNLLGLHIGFFRTSVEAAWAYNEKLRMFSFVNCKPNDNVPCFKLKNGKVYV